MAVAGCSPGTGSDGDSRGSGSDDAAPGNGRPMKLIGDGSTAYTGAQPNQPTVSRMTAGSKPPQFVVFSWDGAGEDGQRLFSHFRKVARENDAAMTYFLSGVYVLPREKRMQYAPPGHARGASDIGYLDEEEVAATLEQVRGAWLEGSEIGTHFNGHFCGRTGVASWSKEDWKSEIAQAKQFVQQWKTNTGRKKADPLPFDYDKELVGGRAPCLEGQENLMKAAKEMGFRYDTSGVSSQVWPKKKEGIWDLSLQEVPFPGRAFEVVSMDYNFMANQSGTAYAPAAQHEAFERQMREGLLAGFERAYTTNRAPLVIGNHFESWNGGAYMRAVEDTIKTVCKKKDVHCVSFRQLADWLDAQDPAALARLQTLDVGEQPAKGWEKFLSAPAKRGSAQRADGPAGSAQKDHAGTADAKQGQAG
ncbi:hypothetical protein GCM10010400_57800 [Streptomyces aculeolatus]